jgi:virginiamycin B lyase
MRHRAQIVDLRFDLYGTKPLNIAIGDQQSLWVTCATTTEVVGLMRDGSVEHYPVDAVPDQIALGGESIWFTMPIIDTVGRIDHTGAIQNYSLPTGSSPRGIATNEDFAWVTLSGTGDLARISTGGIIDIVQPVVTGDDGNPFDRAASGPQFAAIDGRRSLWFTSLGSADIVRMDVGGATESWMSPDCSAPSGISVDNEAVWIADNGDGGIWRIGIAEKLLQRVEPWPTGGSVNIASDRAGGCWFTEPDDDLVGHIDADAELTEYDISEYGMRPGGIAVDRQGTPWVVLQSGGVIGLVPPSV